MKKGISVLIETTDKHHDNKWVLFSFFLWIYILGFLSTLLLFSEKQTEFVFVLSIMAIFSIFLLLPMYVLGIRKKYMLITDEGISWPFISIGSLLRDLEGDFIHWENIRRISIKKTSGIVKRKDEKEQYFSTSNNILEQVSYLTIYTSNRKYGISSTDLEKDGMENLLELIKMHIDEDVFSNEIPGDT